MNRWRTAALQGVYVGAIAVIASILTNGTLHGWESLTQPGFWGWEVIVFALAALITTALIGSGLWGDGTRNKTSDT
jgi:hypothetical protein